MGFTGETPQGGVALPNSYVVALKPELTDQEVESHINTIKSLVDNAQSDISGLPGSQTQFDKFLFAPGVDVSGEGKPDVGFRGYMGTFTPNILQEIEESPLVRLKSRFCQSIGFCIFFLSSRFHIVFWRIIAILAFI